MTRQELIADFQHFLDTHKEEVQAHICKPPYDWMDEDDWEERAYMDKKEALRLLAVMRCFYEAKAETDKSNQKYADALLFALNELNNERGENEEIH